MPSHPPFWGGKKRAGEAESKLADELRCQVFFTAMRSKVRARRHVLMAFDCAAAEAYYVGDPATMDGRDEIKAVILKVEL